MKKLMRMKLINWHRFTNETIEWQEQVLVSGENGAGKSTLLDALQFVLTASKNHFNKAAHENGKRKLAGYVRYKTGKENRPYERTGEVTAHVALEFYEEEKKKYFIVGAVIDSASESQEKTLWYRMENKRIEDNLFLSGNQIKKIDAFKLSNKPVFINLHASEARKDFRNRFGRLEERFCELIPKALAFKPIDNIKDFVYSYVLDEKEVNIDNLKENVRSYQDLEKLLQVTKAKIEKLEIITQIYNKILEYEKKDLIYSYYISRADVDQIKQEILHLQKEIQNLNCTLEQTFAGEARLQKEMSSLKKEIAQLDYELMHNQDYMAYKEIESQMEEVKQRIEELKRNEKVLIKTMQEALLKGENLRRYNPQEKLLESYIQALEKGMVEKDIEALSKVIKDYSAYKEAKQEQLTLKSAQKEEIRKQLVNQLIELEGKIEDLKKQQLRYPDDVVTLKQTIQAQFNALKIQDEPRILCELLNILNPKWTNAIEGYLNTQRFYLLVEPKNFDLATSTYEKIRKEKGLHSVGIINTGKLEKYQTCSEGSLAEEITTESIGARCFINMLLGKVTKCEKVEKLKNYHIAITPSCMLYQNHVVRGLNPQTYHTPYIGKEAYKIQLEQAEEEKVKREQQKKEIEVFIEELNQQRDYLKGDQEAYIQYNMGIIPDKIAQEESLIKLEARKKELNCNNTYLQKQMLLGDKKKELSNLEEKKDAYIRNQTQIEIQIEGKQKASEDKEGLLNLQEQGIIALEERLGYLLQEARKEYEALLVRKSDLFKLREDYVQTRKGNATLKMNHEGELITKMQEYKNKHDFGAEASKMGMPAFSQELAKLKESELLEYEGKVYQARQAAELEFKEQFLSKLQENIKKAQKEFKILNEALKDIQFGQEKYAFKYGESKRFGKYYQMIMDDLNMMQGFSLLSGAFNEKHKEVIEELFEKLTIDEENSSKTLEEFTDYRTYMDYDIDINHGDGTHSYYSKVAEEKSGGETQTPFYVTIAASFVQLYTSRIGSDAVGIVLFDEAFNNMDDERITGVLEFLRRLPLQLIIAAPPDKIQYIGPYMKSTLLVLKDGTRSFVEAYNHESL